MWEGMGIGGFPGRSRAGVKRAMGVSSHMAGHCDGRKLSWETRGSARQFLARGFVRKLLADFKQGIMFSDLCF